MVVTHWVVPLGCVLRFLAVPEASLCAEVTSALKWPRAIALALMFCGANQYCELR